VGIAEGFFHCFYLSLCAGHVFPVPTQHFNFKPAQAYSYKRNTTMRTAAS
jgi:hypothetical protein